MMSANGALDDFFEEGIRPYIDIIDNLRRQGLQQYVELPNVVVVGDQSSGKSSIIEVISGIQLPRGTGIVTRCPLELQLKKTSNEPWKSIITYKTTTNCEVMKVISDPKTVEHYVSEAQEHLCHTKKGVSQELITLRVESPAEHAPDLTMIDLPGIARTAVEGQPADICDQIRKIIMTYVKNENTVILCVISGDLDIGVNESVNIAKLVDPEGLRTIGVITKPDIADLDHKKEILKMMDLKIVNLKKGFNLVKCRSSEQLKNKVPLSEFLVNEMEYYENDDIYREANQSRVGALNLSKKITEELVNVIKKNLPNLRSKIELLLEVTEEKLMELPKGVPQSDQDKRSYIMNIASELSDKKSLFLCQGEVPGDDNYHHTWREYYDKFRKALDKKWSKAFIHEFSIANLENEMVKFRSKEISGFLSYKLFEKIIVKHIQSYKRDAKDLILSIGKVVKINLDKIFTSSTSHLPYIENDLKKILNSEFEKNFKIAEERNDFIFKQECLVFTMDNVFDKKWDKNEGNIKAERLKESLPIKAANSERMRNNIKCYIKIVHTRLCDYIPMAAMQCLMIQMNEDLKIRIFQYLSNQEIIEKIKEDPEMSECRKKLSDKISCLTKGKLELDNKYDYLNVQL